MLASTDALKISPSAGHTRRAMVAGAASLVVAPPAFAALFEDSTGRPGDDLTKFAQETLSAKPSAFAASLNTRQVEIAEAGKAAYKAKGEAKEAAAEAKAERVAAAKAERAAAKAALAAKAE